MYFTTAGDPSPSAHPISIVATFVVERDGERETAEGEKEKEQQQQLTHLGTVDVPSAVLIRDQVPFVQIR